MNLKRLLVSLVLLLLLLGGSYACWWWLNRPAPKIEAKVTAQSAFERIRALQEVEYFEFMSASISGGIGKVLVKVSQQPVKLKGRDDGRYYWRVSVGEELENFFQEWKQMAVDVETGLLLVFDFNENDFITVDHWRRKREER